LRTGQTAGLLGTEPGRRRTIDSHTAPQLFSKPAEGRRFLEPPEAAFSKGQNITKNEFDISSFYFVNLSRGKLFRLRPSGRDRNRNLSRLRADRMRLVREAINSPSLPGKALVKLGLDICRFEQQCM
jgi:hypothetical protein